jgi:hypothetical protein
VKPHVDDQTSPSALKGRYNRESKEVVSFSPADFPCLPELTGTVPQAREGGHLSGRSGSEGRRRLDVQSDVGLPRSTWQALLRFEKRSYAEKLLQRQISFLGMAFALVGVSSSFLVHFGSNVWLAVEFTWDPSFG